MKLILNSILLLACCGTLLAQTNAAGTNTLEEINADAEISSSETNTVPVTETHIYSDSWEFGIKTHSAIYRGNVRLDDPRIQLTCEQLTANVPAEGERIEKVIAETNVVIIMVDDKGLTNWAFADRATYTYEVTAAETNETVVLSGETDPRIERPDGVMYGNPITWDRTHNKVHATNQRMTYRKDPTTLRETLSSKGTNTVDQEFSTTPEPVSEQDPETSGTNSITDE